MLIQAISSAYYTSMRNYAALSLMSANNTRLGLLNNAGNNINFGSLYGLAAMDTQLEMEGITAGLQYKIASAMLEQLKKEQKEESKHFNAFA